MTFTVRYTKGQYQAKITELQGYYSQLESHLSNMEGLKEKMYQFWDDENARTTGTALASEIRQVKNAMDRTRDMLTFYKGAIDKLDATNISVGSTITDALDVLGKLGI